MDDAVAGMPAPAAEAAGGSLAGGMAVATRIGGPEGQRLLDTAQDAFLSGMHAAALVAAAVALAAAVAAVVLLPARAAEPADAAAAPEPELLAA